MSGLNGIEKESMPQLNSAMIYFPERERTYEYKGLFHGGGGASAQWF
jgi:hypothetical protein